MAEPSSEPHITVATNGDQATSSRGPSAFVVGLSVLGALPLLPEFWLLLGHYDDAKAFASIAYYECIASMLLLAPALVLPRRIAQGWVIVIGSVFALATLLTGFQAITVGARWDSTAHAAIFETNAFEASGFIHAFLSVGTVLWLLFVAAGFVAAIVVNIRSRPPRRRAGVALLAIGLLVSSYGIRNAIRYGGNPVHQVKVSNDTTLSVVEAGINAYHPVLRLALTHWNYVSAHAYRLRVLRETHAHLAELEGATVMPGATPPRVLLIVIGESASRRHWSLYGYHRNTTPELAALGNELLVFRDTVCRTVGTLTEIQGMLCTDAESLPVFALFADAGYKTHWFSAQLDQGPNDVKVAAIVQTCADRVFLNGAYDENLVPLVRRAVAEPGKHLILVNLFGSHVSYDDRYPARFAVFHGEGEKEHRLAAYDNTIHYTDHVLAEMISVLRERDEPSCFLYLSDHAEDVYDSDSDHYLFRSDSVATDAMYEIPLVAWFSPAYARDNPTFVATARAAQNTPFQSKGLYHTLIDLARLRHRIYDAHLSLFSPDYLVRGRHIGISRIYRAGTKK